MDCQARRSRARALCSYADYGSDADMVCAFSSVDRLGGLVLHRGPHDVVWDVGLCARTLLDLRHGDVQRRELECIICASELRDCGAPLLPQPLSLHPHCHIERPNVACELLAVSEREPHADGFLIPDSLADAGCNSYRDPDLESGRHEIGDTEFVVQQHVYDVPGVFIVPIVNCESIRHGIGVAESVNQ